MQSDPLIGQQLGAYRILSKLGEGGMARVYKGYHARLRRDVAIKIILSQIADLEGFKTRFEREAQLIASLQHPNIVAVYDFGDTDNLTYLVMQYVGGGTLRDELRGGHALEPREAIPYCQQMARALHHAHQRGIVHRDVKPQNMLISATDRTQLLLSDFGIAKLYDSRHEPTLHGLTGSRIHNDPSLTNVDQIVGTAEYMSPEQINGEPVDARTDVYALGVVLFQMLAGEVPFHSTTVQGLLYQHIYTPPPPLREINPYVPEIVAQITAKAMAKAPEDRFQSAQAMAQALETADRYATDQLSSSPPSYYGPQSPPPYTHAAATPPPPSNYGMIPPYASSPHITNPTVTSLSKPAFQARVGRVPKSYIGLAFVILLAIALFVVKQGIIPWFDANQNNPSAVATSFTENFQNNDRNWPTATSNGLTTGIVNNQYEIDINGGPVTYFPHPNVGTLPENFSLTVTMKQTQGDPNDWYGLAFREKDDGNGSNVTCYAFGVKLNGMSTVLEYNPNAQNQETSLGGSTNPVPGFKAGLNQLHILQVLVQGSKFFFKIDNQPVPVSPAPDQSITDSTYTGGQFTLYVSGSTASFVVMSVQLSTQ